jgi:hypothetical protein
VEIASKLNHLIDENQLAELGKLEQDLVYGDATSKEVIAFLTANQSIPAADKVRAGTVAGDVRERAGVGCNAKLAKNAFCCTCADSTCTATCRFSWSPVPGRACRCGC